MMTTIATDPPSVPQVEVWSKKGTMDPTAWLQTMMAMRGKKSSDRTLNCWNGRETRSQFTNFAFSNLDNKAVTHAYREWVVNGENSPPHGDLMFDLMLLHYGTYKQKTNSFFYKEGRINDDGDLVYTGCLLRCYVCEGLGAMEFVPQIVVESNTLTMIFYDEEGDEVYRRSVV